MSDPTRPGPEVRVSGRVFTWFFRGSGTRLHTLVTTQPTLLDTNLTLIYRYPSHSRILEILTYKLFDAISLFRHDLSNSWLAD